MTSPPMYRFRSAAALLHEFHELERQEIYFSTAGELNDPMEGYRDVVWRGDEVAWRNLFRHYGRLLAISTPLVMLEERPIDAVRHLANAHRMDMHPPTPELRQLADKVAREFVAAEPVATVIKTFAARARAVRRDELVYACKALHRHALGVVAREPLSGLSDASDFHALLAKWDRDAHSSRLGEVFQSASDEHAAVHDVAASLARQIEVLSALETEALPPSRVAFLLIDAPDAYVRHLETVLFPPAHSACFVTDPGDAAMWSAYADSHRGMCLKFRTRGLDGRACLDLRRVVGWDASRPSESRIIRDFVPMNFSPIDYVENFPEIEFFTAYGTAPRGVLHRDWHFDGEVRSSIATHFDDEDAWRKAHWDRFRILTLQKTQHWRHEKEMRLVLATTLSDLRPVDERKAIYRFEDLEAVILGARTPVADVAKTLSILRTKCAQAGRDTFELYQARFESSGGAMAFDRLRLLEGAVRPTKVAAV